MQLILITLLVAVLVGLAAGGSPAGFPAAPVRRWWLAVARIALQIAPLTGELAFAALVASSALLIAFAAISVGDICVHLGVGWFIVAGMRPADRKRRSMQASGGRSA